MDRVTSSNFVEDSRYYLTLGYTAFFHETVGVYRPVDLAASILSKDMVSYFHLGDFCIAFCFVLRDG